MRTSLFLIALALTDIAKQMGQHYPPNAKELWTTFLLFFIVMDIVDFVRGKS